MNNMLLRTGELAALLVGAAGLFILLALLSYSPADPGWANSGWSDSADTIANHGGIIGAWIANLLFWLLGYTAWLVPFILLGYGLLIGLGRRLQLSVGELLIRFGAALLAVIALATLFALNSPQIFECGSILLGYPCGSGGVVGYSVAATIFEHLGAPGSRLILLAAALFGLSLSSGLSWIKAVELVGKITLKILSFIMLYSVALLTTVSQWYLNWRQRRLLKSQQADTVLIGHDEPTQKVPPATPARKLTLSSAASADQRQTVTRDQKKRKKQPRAKKSANSTTVDIKTLPSVDLLEKKQLNGNDGYSDEELRSLSQRLESKLSDFGIQSTVETILPGPVITRFEIQPAAGIKVSRISVLAKDLARSLAVKSVRVVEVIPGKSVVGIEIPNETRSIVMLRDLLESSQWRNSTSSLSLALGKDISGNPVVAALEKMPHLLVAGTTGSGKSMGINAMLLSLLFKCSPEQVRLVLVDPKMLELAVYDGIPHLLTPVITDMKDAANGLRWCVAEMEKRYRKMAALGVRNLNGYNKKIEDAEKNGTPLTTELLSSFASSAASDKDSEQSAETYKPLEKLHYIVVVIDEFADMFMVVGKKVEELIARLAQKARASGIHLILATQRPSVDVITGLIKANIPTRISYQVSTRVDSRTILDQMGAEQLLGHGDMLFLPPGTGIPQRIHGAYVSDKDVHRAVAEWKMRAEPDYLREITDTDVDPGKAEIPGLETLTESEADRGDALYEEAVKCVMESRRASASYVQRRLRIGYNRAARLLEMMESRGLVSAMGSNGNREVLKPGEPG